MNMKLTLATSVAFAAALSATTASAELTYSTELAPLAALCQQAESVSCTVLDSDEMKIVVKPTAGNTGGVYRVEFDEDENADGTENQAVSGCVQFTESDKAPDFYQVESYSVVKLENIRVEGGVSTGTAVGEPKLVTDECFRLEYTTTPDQDDTSTKLLITVEPGEKFVTPPLDSSSTNLICAKDTHTCSKR